MAINYAAKYSEKIDERFALMSVTAPAVNDDFDFIGVKNRQRLQHPHQGPERLFHDR